MSITALKIIALIAMTIDHIGEFLPNNPIWFRWIGRIAAPIFVFCLAEAVRHTKDRKKYCIRLYEMTCICAGVFFITARITWLLGENLYPGIIENNIFATLFQIAILIVVIDGCIEKSVYWKRNLSLYLFWQCAIFIINTAIVRGIINTGIFGDLDELRYVLYGPLCNISWNEGGWYWILLGLLFYYVPKKKVIWYPLYCIINIMLDNVRVIPNLMYHWSVTGRKTLYKAGMFFFGIFLHQDYFFRMSLSLLDGCQWMMVFAIIPIVFYNGRYGRGLKKLFYIYYPAHIAVLYLLGNLFHNIR